jgi:hypothetical protein
MRLLRAFSIISFTILLAAGGVSAALCQGPSFMYPLLALIMKMPLRACASSLSTTMMHAGMPVP